MKKVFACLMVTVLFAMQFLSNAGSSLAYLTVKAVDETEKLHYYMLPSGFSEFGSWKLNGSFVVGRSSSDPNPEGSADYGDPAIAAVQIQDTAQYRLWVRDRDYATNQPGTRSFQVSVDDTMVDNTFGVHGQEGFRWTDAGTFQLDAGMHEISLWDTSAFYARCEGLFLTKDLDLVPPQSLDDMLQLTQPENPLSFLPSADFPAWATGDVAAGQSAVIENEKVKIIFYKGQGTEGDLVQNEIFIRENNQWIQVKEKTEQLGFLMMSAADSEFIGQNTQFMQIKQKVNREGGSASGVVEDFFGTGYPVWFIPDDFEQVSDDRIDLSFSNTEAQLSVRFEFDDLSYEPKVTLEAEFAQDGAYSFLFFNGNATAYEDYETVTAPLLYVKKTVPSSPSIIPECYLFTPMATLHYAQGNDRFNGREMTSGIVMDPTSVPQDYAYPETSAFGLVLRDQQGDVRPQFTAPLFGTEDCFFEAGDQYSVSYRIINETGSWYDTYKHVAQDIFNATDLRTNYYHSLNEAIYNATDLMMDDEYGGWDPVNMAHYNMEERDMTSLSNSMSALQRYLLTENQDIWDERAAPTLAYLLSRKQTHFKATDSVGGASYSSVLPVPIGGPITSYASHVYGGLYEMTQGRMPFLLDYAVDNLSSAANINGVAGQSMMYNFTGDEAYLDKVKAAADGYMANNDPNQKREVRFVNGFVYGDYIPAVATMLAAYEATGEQKYLDSAEENARILTTSLWTTGYHDDYAQTDYTVTQEKTGTRPLNAENYTFWWHGNEQWRLGNVDGEAKSAQELGVPLETETAPGWLGGRVGMGTEHPATPGHGNVITMNNWVGMLSRLSVYTGDDFFYTMARNAMIGRFGNYAGYYQDRIIFHQMTEEYPYEGPDFTSIYWHHIPVFISMLEDFLINSTWVKSQQNIEFPSVYQSGYAYFISDQYGFEPGTFYDEEDMWLWLDRGIVESDSVEIDYLAAKKDGVLGVAFMNEGNAPITTTIRLGEKVDTQYTGTATLYDADGTGSTVSIVNGEFVLTIPAKGIQSVVLHDMSEISAPVYANDGFEISNYTEGNTASHTRGTSHVIQVAPESYHAYVYITDMATETTKLTMTYQIGEEEFTAEKVGYPYEFLIKVDDPEQSFTYQLFATHTNGQTEALGGATLTPYDFTHPGIDAEQPQNEETLEFPAYAQLTGTGTQTLQFTVPVESFYPLLPAQDLLDGMTVFGGIQTPSGQSVNLDSTIVSTAVTGNGTLQIEVELTDEVPFDAYEPQEVILTVNVPKSKVLYEAKTLKVSAIGMHQGRNEIRIVVPLTEFSTTLSENSLSGLPITGTLTSKTNPADVLTLNTTIRGNEMRDTSTVLVLEPTKDVPLADYNGYTFNVQGHFPKSWKTPAFSEAFDPVVKTTGLNTTQKLYRVVLYQQSVPFTVTADSLNGYRVTGELRRKSDGTVLRLNSFILDTELRAADGEPVISIPFTSQVPYQEYMVNNYDITLTIYPQLAGIWGKDDPKSGSFRYTLDTVSGTAAITGYTGSGDVVIPSAIGGFSVSAIGDSAFQSKKLTSVTIPDSVVSIGDSAFRDNVLTTVLLPADVGQVASSAFRANSMDSAFIAGAQTAFGSKVFHFNAAGFTVYGCEDSLAQAMAASNGYSFVVACVPQVDAQISLIDGLVGEEYAQALEADSAFPVEWSLNDGVLPEGLKLQSDGEISGIPEAVGSYAFSVQAENAVGYTTQDVTLNITDRSLFPGVPVLSHDNGYENGLQDGDYTISMNMWWGVNGTVYTLYENGVLIDTQTLTSHEMDAQSAVTAVSNRPNGTYEYYCELTNASGTVTSAPMVVQVSQAIPGKPVLSHDNWDKDGDYTVTVDLWWGTNAGSYVLYENGVQIESGELDANTPGAQSVSVEISGKTRGEYVYTCEFINGAGAAQSDSITVIVEG